MMIALVGLNANAAMYIVGNNPFGNWHTYTGAEMTDNGNGIYTYVTDQINGTVWFVFADNLTTGDSDDWNTFNGNYRYGPLTSGQAITAGIEYTTQKSTNGNVSYSFAGTLGESYQFTFDTNTMKFKVEGYVAPVIINTYSVAGEPAEVFGNPTWNEKATETEMTLVDGLYTWTKNGVELTSGTTVAFKIVGNHDWGYAWPADNYVDTISETGTYNLTFTFNADNEEVNLVAEKVGEGPVIDPFTGSLYITGQVNGNGWNPSTAIEMTNAGDDDTFTLANAQITDSGDGFGYFSFMSMLGTDANTWPANEYRLGAAADGTPAVLDEFVDMGGFNTTGAFKIEPGYYNITVVLSGGSNGLLKLTAGEAPEPVVDDVYILGDVNNIGWNATDGVKMTFNEGIYTANITTQNQGDLGIAYFGFTKKLAETNDSIGWASIAPYRFGPVSEGAFVMTKELLGNECSLATDGSFESIAIPEGTWTVTVDLVNNKFTINGEWPTDTITPEPEGNVYIIGEVNDKNWAPNDGVQMTFDEENNVYTATVTFDGRNTEGEEGAEEFVNYFGLTKKLGANDQDWATLNANRLGSETDGNYWVTPELMGQEIGLVCPIDMAYRIAKGEYTITVNLENMTMVINQAGGLRGDVDNNKEVGIADVSALIDYLLNGDASAINLQNANCNLDEGVGIADVSALIDYLLSGNWAE
jgi:hypothetical protein